MFSGSCALKLEERQPEETEQPREATTGLRFAGRAGSSLPIVGPHIWISKLTQISHICNFGLGILSIVLMRDWSFIYLERGKVQIHLERLTPSVISTLVCISSNSFLLSLSSLNSLKKGKFLLDGEVVGNAHTYNYLRLSWALRLWTEWWENTCGEKNRYSRGMGRMIKINLA